jgi:hypothetical protein
MSQLKTFHQALEETGFVEGQNVAIEYRWAENQIGRFIGTSRRLGAPQGLGYHGWRQPGLRIGSNRPVQESIHRS